MPSAAIFSRRESNRSATAGAGGFETTTITSADPVRHEQVERELGHHAAYRRREVTAADPDQRRVPDTGPVE